MAGRPAPGGGQTITAETYRQRMRTIRQFFERIMEWDWPGAPPRNPVIAWDVPRKPEPLQKFPGRPGRRETDGRRPGQRRPARPARGRAPTIFGDGRRFLEDPAELQRGFDLMRDRPAASALLARAANSANTNRHARLPALPL
jgi:hypothetical protein